MELGGGVGVGAAESAVRQRFEKGSRSKQAARGEFLYGPKAEHWGRCLRGSDFYQRQTQTPDTRSLPASPREPKREEPKRRRLQGI